MNKEFYATEILCQLSSKLKLWENRSELTKRVKKLCRKYKKSELRNWFFSQLRKQNLYIGGKLLKPHC